MKKLKISILLLLFSLPLFAAEGMFLLNDFPWKAARKAGLKLKAEAIYHEGKASLSDAIVQIGGGSGSFISPEGLVITNHHVAFQAIQRLATPENNILKNGFYAKEKSEELYAEGYSATITLSQQDVTETILNELNDAMTPLERHNAIESAMKKLVAKAEKEKGIKAYVRSMYNGRSYYLFRTLRFQDVRLVYAPAQSVGEYGGDIDNWMWPRHTGDFSMMRVYTAPDGSPAVYSPENIPFKPKHFLPISAKPLRDGDFTMIMGYPGGTQRHLTAREAAYTVNKSYPERIQRFKMMIDKIEEMGKNDEAVALKLASRIKGLNNVYKNNQGMLDGFAKMDIIGEKYQFEAALKKKYANDPEKKELFAQLEAFQDDKEALDGQSNLMGWLSWSPQLHSVAGTLVRKAIEGEKADADRKMGWQDRDTLNLQMRIKRSLASFHPPLDQWVMAHFMLELAQDENAGTLNFWKAVKGAFPDKTLAEAIPLFTEKLYAESRLANPELWQKLFYASLDELQQCQDPMVQFALLFEEDMKQIRQKEDALSGRRTLLMPRYFDLLAKESDQNLYPDANSTIRFTYGIVAGYEPQDAVWYYPFTTLKGMVTKHTGKEPFNAPEVMRKIKLTEKNQFLWDKKLGDFPVNFLHTTDITGGNSGSPVLNAKGHFIGTAFDGNYEAMTSDWKFSEAVTRTISVDSRYVLLVLLETGDHKALLDEITIIR
jgi:hypothetical protein